MCVCLRFPNLHCNGCNVPLNVFGDKKKKIERVCQVVSCKTVLIKESVFSKTAEPTSRATPCILVLVRASKDTLTLKYQTECDIIEQIKLSDMKTSHFEELNIFSVIQQRQILGSFISVYEQFMNSL